LTGDGRRTPVMFTLAKIPLIRKSPPK
jgi:hypothetical protein